MGECPICAAEIKLADDAIAGELLVCDDWNYGDTILNYRLTAGRPLLGLAPVLRTT